MLDTDIHYIGVGNKEDGTVDQETVMALMSRYGELDGEIVIDMPPTMQPWLTR